MSRYSEKKLKNSKNIETGYRDKKLVLNNYPRIIQLEHTTRCNLACIGCHHFCRPQNFGTDLDINIVHKLQPLLEHAERIQLNGGGEPFLHPKIENILEIYRNYELRIVATTNLTFLTPRIQDAIKNSFSQLNLSCDGASSEVFSGIRRNSDYARWLSNVRKVRKLRDDLILVFGVTVMRENIHELSDIVKLAHTLGINKIVFGRMIPHPATLPHTVSDDPLRYKNYAMLKLLEAKELAEKYKISAIIPNLIPSIDPFAAMEEERLVESHKSFPTANEQAKLRREHAADSNIKPCPSPLPSDMATPSSIVCSGICDWLHEIAFIDLWGRVATCCLKGGISMGDATHSESFLSNVWNNHAYQSLRECFNNGYIPKFCEKCQFIFQKGTLSHLELLTPEHRVS